MAKIVIIAPTEADDDVKDAVKLLKAAGHDVDTEEPTPKSLLHIVLGLMGPSAYGFGPGYAYSPGADAADDEPTEEEEPAEEDATADAGGDDDFNFESLGPVSVDGELIEAVTHDSDKSELYVVGLTNGAKMSYVLNESRFSFWPDSKEQPEHRVSIDVNSLHLLHTVSIHEAVDKPVLKVGRDMLNVFKK